MNNTFFLFVAPSGAGKTTLVTALEKQHNLKSVVSYTTRKPRCDGEIGHIFVTNDEFDKLTDMVGYTNYNGNRYCATSQQVEENDLYVIDPKGIEYFKHNYKGNKEIKVIYLDVPLPDRYERMKLRYADVFESGTKEQMSEAYDEILGRIINDVVEFKDIKQQADFVVQNGDNVQFKNVVRSVWDYIKQCRKESEE